MKIGIFDSGIGGLSVANSLLRRNPNIELVYIADSKYLPYGSQSKSLIDERVKKMMDFLVTEGCDHIICACNTAYALSAKVINSYKSKISVSNVTESFISGFSDQVETPDMILVATENTIQSQVYSRLLASKSKTINLKTIPAGELVILIENGAPQAAILEVLNRYKKVYNIQSEPIILGCTHYNWVEEAFKVVFSSNVIYSSNQVFDHLFEEEAAKANFGTLVFYDTGDSSQMQEKVLDEYCSFVRELSL